MKTMREDGLLFQVILPTALAVIAGASLVSVYVIFPNFASKHNTLFGPLAILFSACIALISARFAINAQKHIARARATYDSIARKEWDKDYISARTLYSSVVSNDKNKLEDYAYAKDLTYGEDKEKSNAIRSIANDHELMAIAIRRGILDEDFVRLWHETSIKKDFHDLKLYIDRIRQRNKRAYTNFEKLVASWESAQ